MSVPSVSLRPMALSVHERDRFLAEPHIAALSVSAGPDRGPLTVPIWYQYTPGGEAWVLPPPDSRKARVDRASRTLQLDGAASRAEYPLRHRGGFGYPNRPANGRVAAGNVPALSQTRRRPVLHGVRQD